MSLNFVHFIISELQRVRDRKEQDLRDLIERKMNLTQEMVDMLDEFEKKELERLRKNYELCGLGDRAQSPEIESIIRMVQLEMKERKPENESVNGANQASD